MEKKRVDFFKANVLEKIKEDSNVAIITHVNPDGDGFAAALALQEILSYNNKKAEIILEKPIPKIYDYIQGRSRSIVYNTDLIYENLFVLDCHELSRIGTCGKLVSGEQNIFILDHHEEQVSIETDMKIIDQTYVSVGAMVYEIFKDEIFNAPELSRKYIADAIYTTILNDTNNFINANTDARTFNISSELLSLGLKPGEIAEKFLMNRSASQLTLIGEVLSKIDLRYEGKILFMVSTLQQLTSRGLDASATDKMTTWVKGCIGVEVIVYFRECEEGVYKLSLRSNVINVNKIARNYGGGGHIKASGCSIKGDINTIKNRILHDIVEQY